MLLAARTLQEPLVAAGWLLFYMKVGNMQDDIYIGFHATDVRFVVFKPEIIPFGKSKKWEVKGYGHTQTSERTRLAIPPALPVTFLTSEAAESVAQVYSLLLTGLTIPEVNARLEYASHRMGE